MMFLMNTQSCLIVSLTIGLSRSGLFALTCRSQTEVSCVTCILFNWRCQELNPRPSCKAVALLLGHRPYSVNIHICWGNRENNIHRWVVFSSLLPIGFCQHCFKGGMWFCIKRCLVRKTDGCLYLIWPGTSFVSAVCGSRLLKVLGFMPLTSDRPRHFNFPCSVAWYRGLTTLLQTPHKSHLPSFQKDTLLIV